MKTSLLLLCLLLWNTASFAASISTTSGRMEVWSGDGTQYRSSTQLSPSLYSGSLSDTNEVNGATAQSSYEISALGIHIAYSLFRPATLESGGLAQLEMAEANGFIHFTVDEPVHYRLAAEMTAVDLEGRNTTQWLRMFDNGVKYFDNFQLSHATPNEHFMLGYQDGDFHNELMGSTTGIFLPGRTYRFEYYSRILDEPTPSFQTASASGFYSLVIIPEPSAAVLILLGLIGLGRLRSHS